MKANVNGIDLKYQITGSGRLIALCHSLGMKGEIFDPLRPQLERHGRILSWDARGHGDSEKPNQGWTVEDMAADLRSLIEHLGDDQAVIGGISMGGNTALAYAIAYPQKTEALILLDTTAWYGEGAPDAWEERATTAETQGLEPFIPLNLPRWFSDGFPRSHPHQIRKLTDILLAMPGASYAKACRALGRFDVREGLRRIQCPTLIVVGADDPTTPPAMAEHLHENIANSELHILPGLRHMTPVEDPDQVSQLVADFLGRH